MAETKYKLDGLARLNAAWMFAALAASPLSFLTNGILGKVVFQGLVYLGNILANNGLALLNLGIDFVAIKFDKKNYNEAIDAGIEARDRIIGLRGRLTQEEKDEIDAPVKDAFRDFAGFA